jgi:membrane protein implicated in regulation of membrane protease activity
MTTDRDADAGTTGDWAPSGRWTDRLLWLCPLVGLIAAAVSLGLFGVQLWTAITVALLITCPLVIVWALLIERRQRPFTRKHHE